MKRNSRIIRLEFEAPKKPKAKPRGDPSALIPYRYKKGRVVPPPTKKRKKPDFIAAAYHVELNKPAPPEVAGILSLEDCTWAEAIAFAMIRRAASGDTAAAKEIREVTEGKLPHSVEVDAINYNLAARCIDGQVARQGRRPCRGVGRTSALYSGAWSVAGERPAPL